MKKNVKITIIIIFGLVLSAFFLNQYMAVSYHTGLQISDEELLVTLGEPHDMEILVASPVQYMGGNPIDWFRIEIYNEYTNQRYSSEHYPPIPGTMVTVHLDSVDMLNGWGVGYYYGGTQFYGEQHYWYCDSTRWECKGFNFEEIDLCSTMPIPENICVGFDLWSQKQETICITGYVPDKLVKSDATECGYLCNNGETKSFACTDGTVIITQQCLNNNWSYIEAESCPLNWINLELILKSYIEEIKVFLEELL